MGWAEALRPQRWHEAAVSVMHPETPPAEALSTESWRSFFRNSAVFAVEDV
jgi:hypothetical protein